MHVYKNAPNAMSLCHLKLQVADFTFKQFYFHVTTTVFGRKYQDQYLSRITGIFEIRIQLS